MRTTGLEDGGAYAWHGSGPEDLFCERVDLAAGVDSFTEEPYLVGGDEWRFRLYEGSRRAFADLMAETSWTVEETTDE